jgi:hypothetical protein
VVVGLAVAVAAFERRFAEERAASGLLRRRAREDSGVAASRANALQGIAEYWVGAASVLIGWAERYTHSFACAVAPLVGGCAPPGLP